MNQYWLKKDFNKNLIIFFNGWGMDEKPFKHIKSNNYDVLTLFDYQDIEINETFKDQCKGYDQIVIISWSLGGWVTAKLAHKLPDYNLAIGINTTLSPVNDNYGIPEPTFRATFENLSPENLNAFYRRMFSNKEDFQKFCQIKPNRDLQNQKNELITLYKNILNSDIAFNFSFDRIIIGNKDRIIPAKNQSAFWQNKLNYLLIDAPHYPFFLWQSWEDIIKYANPSK